MTEHAVVIAGGGPTGLMLAGELALAGVDVVIVERRASQELIGSRAGGLHSRTDALGIRSLSSMGMLVR
jgi:3-(3-hydroxy-phenyl)propionate hydroxylase